MFIKFLYTKILNPKFIKIIPIHRDEQNPRILSICTIQQNNYQLPSIHLLMIIISSAARDPTRHKNGGQPKRARCSWLLFSVFLIIVLVHPLPSTRPAALDAWLARAMLLFHEQAKPSLRLRYQTVVLRSHSRATQQQLGQGEWIDVEGEGGETPHSMGKREEGSGSVADARGGVR